MVSTGKPVKEFLGMKRSILFSLVILIIGFAFTSTAAATTAESVVQGLVLDKVQAWKRADGQSRRTIIVRNSGGSALTTQIGQVYLQFWQLIGSTWQPAGFETLGYLAPGASYKREDLPFPNQGASHYKATIVFNERVFAEKVVPVQAGEPAQAAAGVLEGRAVAQAATLEGFSPLIDANSRSIFNLTVRNNTDLTFSEAKNGLMLLQLQINDAGMWRSLNTIIKITSLTPRGVVVFTGHPFPDNGYNQLRAVLVYDKGQYAAVTAPIAGTAERDQRANRIISSLTVQSFDAWRLNDGSGRFTLVVKNNVPEAFVPSMGPIVVQNSGLAGQSWTPAGGWTISSIPANGTAELRELAFNALGATRLASELRHKDKLIARQEKAIAASQGSTAATNQTVVKIALKSVANGKLVCAEDGGGKALIANRTVVGPWETFQMITVGTGKIALKSLTNGKYVCAENAGAQPLIANRTQIGPWETFEKVDRGGGMIALKSMANGKYVCAENAGAQPLIANRTAIGPWEMFIPVVVP